MSAQPQQQVGPQPVPQSITVGELKGGGQVFVVVTIDGPTGSYVSFLDPDLAGQLAARIADVAMHAKTGLVIASGLEELSGQ
jgi:hypothetical protein